MGKNWFGSRIYCATLKRWVLKIFFLKCENDMNNNEIKNWATDDGNNVLLKNLVSAKKGIREKKVNSHR